MAAARACSPSPLPPGRKKAGPPPHPAPGNPRRGTHSRFPSRGRRTRRRASPPGRRNGSRASAGIEKPAAGVMTPAAGWRSGWDSNPRALADNLISSQARYDHFDTAPCGGAVLPEPAGPLRGAAGILAHYAIIRPGLQVLSRFFPKKRRRTGTGRRACARRPVLMSGWDRRDSRITAGTPRRRRSWSGPPSAGRCPWGRSSGCRRRGRSCPPACPPPGCP